MTTNRAKKLEKLAMSLPQGNQQIAQGQQAARQIQLQEQIKQAPQAMGPAAAQQMGAQQAQQAGAIQLGAQQKGQQQAQLMGQMGLEQKAREQRQAGHEQQLSLNEQQMDFANKINKLDTKLKNQLLDEQLVFQKDQANQGYLNERQLLDYAMTKARSREDFLNYQQQVEQVSSREIQMMEAAAKKLGQAIEQGYISKKRGLDNELKKDLIQKKRAIERRIAERKRAAANRHAMIRSVTGIAGGIIGGIAGGGPAGAMAGYQIGQGAGSMLAN